MPLVIRMRNYRLALFKSMMMVVSSTGNTNSFQCSVSKYLGTWVVLTTLWNFFILLQKVCFGGCIHCTLSFLHPQCDSWVKGLSFCFIDCHDPLVCVRQKSLSCGPLCLPSLHVNRQLISNGYYWADGNTTVCFHSCHPILLCFQVSLSMLQLEFAPHGGHKWSNPVNKRLCVPVKSMYHLRVFLRVI